MKISSQALNWMGAREVLAMWRPLTEAGADHARQWPVLTAEAWEEERRCCLALEVALEAGALDDRELCELLRDLPSLDGALAALQSGGGAESAVLFRVKQVLFAALQLLPRVAAVEGYPKVAKEAVAAAYGLLHAPGDPGARFVLSSHRSEALTSARAAEVAAQRALLTARSGGSAAGAFDDLQRAHEATRGPLLAAETALLVEVAASLRPAIHTVAEAFAWITLLDLRLAKCRLRASWAGCWPERGGQLEVEEAQHPSVAAAVASRGGGFVAQSFVLPAGVSTLTGANMGGKSVALQLAGLMLLCGASGLPAPARRVVFPSVDFVEVLAGQEQGSRHGLSSFGSEVVAWKALLAREGCGLVLADEPARTTSPGDGAALLEGLLAAVASRGWHGWFATHFAGVGEGVAVSSWSVAGLRGAVTGEESSGEGSLAALESRMDYRLVAADGAAASDALRVAEALGLGDEVLSIARQLRASVESGSNRSS